MYVYICIYRCCNVHVYLYTCASLCIHTNETLLGTSRESVVALTRIYVYIHVHASGRITDNVCTASVPAGSDRISTYTLCSVHIRASVDDFAHTHHMAPGTCEVRYFLKPRARAETFPRSSKVRAPRSGTARPSAGAAAGGSDLPESGGGQASQVGGQASQGRPSSIIAH